VKTICERSLKGNRDRKRKKGDRRKRSLFHLGKEIRGRMTDYLMNKGAWGGRAILKGRRRKEELADMGKLLKRKCSSQPKREEKRSK